MRVRDTNETSLSVLHDNSNHTQRNPSLALTITIGVVINSGTRAPNIFLFRRPTLQYQLHSILHESLRLKALAQMHAAVPCILHCLRLWEGAI